MLLDGRVALVTGAAGGLGQAICDVFRREGATVVAVDITGEACDHFDVGTNDGTRAMVDLALERHGRLDALILNAGVQSMAPLSEFPEEQWDRLMDVMAKGPFLAIKHAWPTLTARKGGRIVVTASGSSFIGEKYKAAYVAAKHAVAGLVKVAALEGAAAGLTANAVAPGWMMTSLVEGQMADQTRLHHRPADEIVAAWIGRSPAERALDPAEVAEAIAFLASERASGINGAVLPVDLGLLVN